MSEVVSVATAAGIFEAQILKALLESHEVDVWLLQESAGAAVGLGVGRLGQVEIMVAAGQESMARQILEEYYAGKLDPPEGS